MPWLTIVIPVYNVEKYIQKCLDSIVSDNRKSMAGLEVIVVDDGSPDRAGQIADAYASKHESIRVIHQENQGVASARDTGLASARGRWIYFMDPDDWMAKDAARRIERTSRMHPDADILLFDAYQHHAGRRKAWEHFRQGQIWTDRETIARLQRGVLYPPMAHADTARPLAAPWDKVYRRAFLEENALRFARQLNVLDDMVFNMEAFGRASKIVYRKEKIYHYRYVPESITNSYRPDRVEQDRAVWRYIAQYMASQEDLPQKGLFAQAFYCRVVKSFSICCRSCFFHIRNGVPLADQIAYVRWVMAAEPYWTAFWAVRLKDAQWRLKVMILVCRMRWGYGVWLLHSAQALLGNISAIDRRAGT